MTLGYVVMRLAMVASVAARRGCSIPRAGDARCRYAIGIGVVQVGWVARLALPDDAGLVVVLRARGRSSWRSRSGPSGRTRPRGTRATSPSATGCSRSSCSASRCCRPPSACRRRSISTLRSATSALVVVGGLLTALRDVVDLLRPAERAARRTGAPRLRSSTYGARSRGDTDTSPCSRPWPRSVEDSSSRSTTSRSHSDLTSLESALAFTIPVCIFLLSVWAVHYRFKRATWVRSWAVPTTVVLILAVECDGRTRCS